MAFIQGESFAQKQNFSRECRRRPQTENEEAPHVGHSLSSKDTSWRIDCIEPETFGMVFRSL